jgi:hypothetical protein
MRSYAREVSGIALSGRAAVGGIRPKVADRGTAPKAGAVLAFRATHSMRAGRRHGFQVIDERHVLLNHAASWSRPGMIERSAMAEDVSANGDWSEVRVFYAPSASSACAPRHHLWLHLCQQGRPFRWRQAGDALRGFGG